MHYLTDSGVEGGGALYKVSEVSVGQLVDSELVLSGFTTPGGLAQDSAGDIYLAETRPAPEGRVLKLKPSKDTAMEFVTNLDYPTGVAIDSFNQVYIIENGQHQVSKFDATGVYSLFKDTEIESPEVGVMDANDNLFLVESGTQVVSKINPTGERQVVTPPLEGILGVAVDAAGYVNVLTVNASEGYGKIVRILDQNTTEDLVDELVNPLAFAFDSSNAIYIAEGAPVNRITRFAAGESSRRIIVETVDEPLAIIFTPF
jgi:DNA-binding beta-propeller fold protein YncE